MSPNHWEVVNFLRKYYDEYQIAPAVRVLTKAIGKQLGPDKGNSQYLYELVPVRPGEAGVQDRRPAEAHRLRLDRDVARRRDPRSRDEASRMPPARTRRPMTAATVVFALLFYCRDRGARDRGRAGGSTTTRARPRRSRSRPRPPR